MLNRTLNLLAEQQDESVRNGQFGLYKGLCMREAALLRERAETVEDTTLKQTLLDAANEAMARAITIGTMTQGEV